jgi:predicted TIM-barrel fold metal-dependent hydrolase
MTETGGNRMKRSARKLATTMVFSGVAIAALAAGHILFAGQAQPGAPRNSGRIEPIPALTPYVEEHTHFDEKDIAGTVRSALAARGRQHAAMIFLQIPPDTYDHPGHYDAEVILAAVKKYPDQIRVLGGGGSLNAMIIQSVATGDSGAAARDKFKQRAEELLSEGVIGFGEMTAEHFDGMTPYQYAPPNHPLYYLLADIAAEHGVPIVLHMEAVPENMPLPAGLSSPPNPRQIHSNISAFERLLQHNARANIIWAHAGADGTGYRTPDLCRRLLTAHPNLYMEIKADPLAQGLTYPLDADGKLKPEWLKLFTDFPDRFIIGSDQHYPEPKGSEQRWQEVVLLFNQLPGDLRKKIGTQNIAHIYGKSVAASLSAEKN